jgi:metal-responsive CopG/Arc/MetJ family transcriptional regulator
MVYLPPEMISELNRLAREEDRSLSAEIRRAVRYYLGEIRRA